MKCTGLILFLALFTLSAQAQLPPSDGILVDSYAALVNGKVITVGDILSALQPAQARLASQYQGRELQDKIQEQYTEARDALIQSELILMDFELQGGALPDRAIEDHINTIIHDRFNDDRAAFLRALAEQRLTFAEWRKQMKEQLIVQVMRQREVSSKILITPYDVQQAYDRMKTESFVVPEQVSLLTLTLDKGATPEEQEAALLQAQDLRERILAGDLQMEQAADEAGGQVETAEWFEVSTLNASILGAIDGLAPGGLSAPLEIGESLYLVQVVERQLATTVPFDEAAPKIERTLRKAEFERLDNIWLNTLRSKYYVQVFTHNLFD
jgi:peptidyl-prolyl cis-trans isomerase SurA